MIFRSIFFLLVAIQLYGNQESSPLWWRSFPTVGLALEAPFWPPPYPFFPHAFSLWEIAGTKGEGSCVALLDTGVAAFNLDVGSTVFKKHPNLEVAGDFEDDFFNFISEHPYEAIANLLIRFTDRSLQDCEHDARSLAHTTRIEKDSECISRYLLTHGKKTVLSFLGGSLSQEGQRVERMLQEACKKLTPCILNNSKQLFLENIPLISLPEKNHSPIKQPLSPRFEDHGTHVASIVGGREREGFSGIAPEARLFMFKTVAPNFFPTDLHATVKALETVVEKKIPIVNLSLSCSRHWDSQDPIMKRCQEALTKIPYACCAVGNNKKKCPDKITYPARLPSIHFSIGAFGCSYTATTKKLYCSLASFCQTEPGKGPRYLAPGVDVLGCTYHTLAHEPSFGTQSGTSQAAACVSGFLALLLAIVGKSLSVDQCKELCDACSFRLHGTNEWIKKVLCGVLDMRTALFTARVLMRIQKTIDPVTFQKNYTFFLTSILTILFSLPREYGTQCDNPYDFKNQFIDYYNQARRTFLEEACYWTEEKEFLSLEAALQKVTSTVLKLWKQQKGVHEHS